MTLPLALDRDNVSARVVITNGLGRSRVGNTEYPKWNVHRPIAEIAAHHAISNLVFGHTIYIQSLAHHDSAPPAQPTDPAYLLRLSKWPVNEPLNTVNFA